MADPKQQAFEDAQKDKEVARSVSSYPRSFHGIDYTIRLILERAAFRRRAAAVFSSTGLTVEQLSRDSLGSNMVQTSSAQTTYRGM